MYNNSLQELISTKFDFGWRHFRIVLNHWRRNFWGKFKTRLKWKLKCRFSALSHAFIWKKVTHQLTSLGSNTILIACKITATRKQNVASWRTTRFSNCSPQSAHEFRLGVRTKGTHYIHFNEPCWRLTRGFDQHINGEVHSVTGHIWLSVAE